MRREQLLLDPCSDYINNTAVWASARLTFCWHIHSERDFAEVPCGPRGQRTRALQARGHEAWFTAIFPSLPNHIHIQSPTGTLSSNQDVFSPAHAPFPIPCDALPAGPSSCISAPAASRVPAYHQKTHSNFRTLRALQPPFLACRSAAFLGLWLFRAAR